MTPPALGIPVTTRREAFERGYRFRSRMTGQYVSRLFAIIHPARLSKNELPERNDHEETIWHAQGGCHRIIRLHAGDKCSRRAGTASEDRNRRKRL